jgi:aminoglycoside 3-N-acetyltransferase
VAVTREQIANGLCDLGLNDESAVIVHASLRSFGTVEGGARAVCQALVDVCGTVLITAGTWERTGLRPPPGLTRPNNAYAPATSWEEFEAELAKAEPFSFDLPVDRYLGTVAETFRAEFAHERGPHPLFSYLAIGTHAKELVEAQRLDWPLGPIEVLAERGGHVLLLGVDHTANTTIHLAEQRLGRSLFWRYAAVGRGVWAEFPNVSGESHRFDDLEPALAPKTVETRIGDCRARLIAVQDVLDAADEVIRHDPRALLCDDPACERCADAYAQRRAWTTPG